jgi:hypothetical protein
MQEHTIVGILNNRVYDYLTEHATNNKETLSVSELVDFILDIELEPTESLRTMLGRQPDESCNWPEIVA